MTEVPSGEFINSYCCVCERETTHRRLDNDVYWELGLECLICHTIWEADYEDLEDDYTEDD